jgi:hypothetical protein
MRRKICGDAAFLPLTATGHGALNARAIALLNEGYFVKIPSDSKGRITMYLDRSRFENTPEFRIAVMQLVMYMTYVVHEEDEFSQQGFIFVVDCKVSYKDRYSMVSI